MKETILLFGFSKEKQGKLLRSLLPLKMRIKRVEQKELGLPLGVVAGLTEEVGKIEEPASELGDEMLVMAGLISVRVDAVLMALRKGKVGPIPYKAVLTEANQQWNAYELLAELRKEHARFTAEPPTVDKD